jgi:hypothetical protein
MGAPDLLRHLRGAGFTLALADGGIRVAPARDLTDAQRETIRTHRAELLALLSGQTAAALVRAINACCDARGDTDANRAALTAECAQLTPAEQADMFEHFAQQAAIWRHATGASA